jgi:2'-5' RNA ligase
MRLFVAAEIPDSVREALSRGLGGLKRDLGPARWVRAEGIHITLKFLGELEESVIPPFEEAARRGLAGCAPVRIELGGGGFFPDARRPRVAWIGGRANGLERWAEVLEAAAESIGVARERRPFSLHLTLARLERPWGARAVETFGVHTDKWRLTPFEATEAVLFRSELKPSGAVYTALSRWPVGGAE